MRGRTWRQYCLISMAMLAYVAVWANPSVRDQEIAECRTGEIATWGDGKDRAAISSPMRFTYHHAGAPDWFSEPEVVSRIWTAASAWSACGVQGIVGDFDASQSGVILIQWNDKDSGGNFGLANLSRHTLSLGPSAFALLHKMNPSYDARQTLQMVIAHEMGHLYGVMAHSRRCIDVMSYYTNNKGEKCYLRDPSLLHSVPEYRSMLPTACDIDRCRAVNRIAPY